MFRYTGNTKIGSICCRIFDRDGNGQISAAEFRFVMMHLGEQMAEEEVTQMMDEADINGDSLISRYGQ